MRFGQSQFRPNVTKGGIVMEKLQLTSHGNSVEIHQM